MSHKVLNCFLVVIRWAPVCFISAVILWSWYAYVVEMCIFTVENIIEKIVYLVMYHPLLAMFVWSYWQTIFADPGSPSKEFYLSSAVLTQYEAQESEDGQRHILHEAGADLPVQCRTVCSGLRFCDRCKAIKPDRAHHCSVCGKCILKMDHHCPWVNNCVCFTNYKFFVLFLGYALFYCFYVAITSLQYFILFWSGIGTSERANLHILFLFFASVMFALSLLFLFGYHLMLVSNNRSTLESFRAPIFRTGPDKNGFNLGRKENFLEVFGESKRLWFVPLFSSRGDGISYPVRNQVGSTQTYQSTDSTPNSPTHLHQNLANNQGSPNSETGLDNNVSYPMRSAEGDFDSLIGQP